MSEGDSVADRRRLDITEVPDGHYIVLLNDWEEVLVEAEDGIEAHQKAIRRSNLPNPNVQRSAPHLSPTDERRTDVNTEP